MVRLNNDWIVDVDDNGNYMPRKDLHRKKTVVFKDGTSEERDDYEKPIGYYSSLSNAIRGVVSYLIRNCLKEGTYTLEEAAEKIDDINGIFEDALVSVLREG